MEEHTIDGGQRLAGNRPGGRDAARAGRRSAGLAVLVAAVAIGLAACAGGSKSPQGVASLGTSSDASGSGSASAQPTGSPAKLLSEWAACMRSHGDPNQADPTIDSNKVIHVTIPANVSGLTNISTSAGCQEYLSAAQLSLAGGHTPKPPSTATLEKFAECMRANGVPDFPDPSANGFNFNKSSNDLKLKNPAFQHAAKLCATQTGVKAFGGSPPPGSILMMPAAGATNGG